MSMALSETCQVRSFFSGNKGGFEVGEFFSRNKGECIQDLTGFRYWYCGAGGFADGGRFMSEVPSETCQVKTGCM